jgi:glycosyltransferase involved in cell wall biosynthesis
MTAPSTWIHYKPARSLCPFNETISNNDVSIIIPVKDNQFGLNRLVNSINHLNVKPLEIIIVDNNSVRCPVIEKSNVSVTIIKCNNPGPASARNAGANYAKGKWLWFIDSDCVVDTKALKAFINASGTSIGLCGAVKSNSNRLLNRYYEHQQILMPQFANNEPLYLITANCLIHRETFFTVGAFDTSFHLAAGEDIDLGFRLFGLGKLTYVADAIVYHHFEESLESFRSRFHRYGIGNFQLSLKHQIKLDPAPFAPNKSCLTFKVLADIQYHSLLQGFTEAQITHSTIADPIARSPILETKTSDFPSKQGMGNGE